MKCNFDKTILHEFVDSSIDPLEMIFLSEHIKHCKSCERELNLLYETDKKLKSFYSREIQFPNRLNDIGELVVQNLSNEDNGIKGLKEVIMNSANISHIIMENSSRFIKLIPIASLFKNSIGRTYKNIRKKGFNVSQLKDVK